MELVKTQMQISTDPKITTMGTIKQIYRKSGAPGFGKGIGLTLARDLPGVGVYFFSYEMLVR